MQCFELHERLQLNESTLTNINLYFQATSDYYDPFSASWRVFTKHPVTTLMELKDKRVCIQDVMFPLLPRMRGGLYYNTYVVRLVIIFSFSTLLLLFLSWFILDTF